MSDLHERLEACIGKTTYRRLGELTQTHPETVRRYMQGQAPSAQFLAGVCDAFDICGAWLLTGRGPMRVSDVRKNALREADASELLGAVASTLQDLGERLDRLERYVQGLETRIRANGRTLSTDDADSTPPRDAGSSGPHGSMLSGDEAVGRIREAVAKRASSDADRAAPPLRG